MSSIRIMPPHFNTTRKRAGWRTGGGGERADETSKLFGKRRYPYNRRRVVHPARS